MIDRIKIVILLTAMSLGVAIPTRAQQQESFTGFIHGVRANAVKGNVLYQRGDGKFDLEAGHKLEEGDIIRTSRDAYAELLLQPGNYLRIGGETECQIFSDPHEKMRFKLKQGTISFEILSSEANLTFDLFGSRYARELIRVITPNAQILIEHPGIFRINAVAGGQTELIVRDGTAAINGQRVKAKRRAVAATEGVAVTEIDSKLEDNFDVWGRERANLSVNANRSLKKQSPWSDKQKRTPETLIDLPADPDNKKDRGIISAKPGAVNFFEVGVEASRPAKEWEQLSYDWEFEAGDRLRTNRYSFAELSLLPDTYLRLDSESEITFEHLSNDLISLKLVRGSAILDVARYEGKESLPITLSGPSTSVGIVGEGNYRIDVKPNGDQIAVREGKVIFDKNVVSSCHKIAGGTVSDCGKQKTDNFDLWSEHRGEGKFVVGRRSWTRATVLTGLRRGHFRKAGFWLENPGRTDYIFLPYGSPYFCSPYGGNYSTVLVPRDGPVNRVNLDDHPMFRVRPQP
jgi:hypothetical protein